MLLRIAAATTALGLASGCADDPRLTCVTVDLTCAPLYAPTWDNLMTTTITPKCAAAGCHTTAAAQGGLVLDDDATAYAALSAYVVAGDVACSPLTERVFATAPSLVMPRGAPLSPAEACAVAQWVAAGAPGPVAAGGGQ
ncbi:MAG: c-type cytochrome domain-containing protein [Kofleriaceae bacterium]